MRSEIWSAAGARASITAVNWVLTSSDGYGRHQLGRLGGLVGRLPHRRVEALLQHGPGRTGQCLGWSGWGLRPSAAASWVPVRLEASTTREARAPYPELVELR